MKHLSTKRILLGVASAALMVMTWFVDGEVQDDQIRNAVKEELERLKLTEKKENADEEV